MKCNFRVFNIMLAFLLLSSIVLTGCGGDMPAQQPDLQKKFSAMYDISEDNKTITVISKQYLDDFWHSNYAKEVPHSLTTEEVHFIIEDSIRIYTQYEKVVLTGFSSVSSNKQVAERFPYIESQEICRSATSPSNSKKMEADIYTIIMYRLKALSSPKAFFTGEEAIRFAGEDPLVCSTMLPWSTFYIPDYSERTNRDYILFVVGYNKKMNSTVDIDRFSDLFSFCNKNGAFVYFQPKTGEQFVNIFPADESYKSPALGG